MEHEDATFPFGGRRGAIRLVGVFGAAALLAVVAAHRHPRGALEPWRPGPTVPPAAQLTRSLTPEIGNGPAGETHRAAHLGATSSSSKPDGAPVR